MENKKNNNKLFIAIIVILIILLVGAIVYILYTNDSKEVEEKENINEAVSESANDLKGENVDVKTVHSNSATRTTETDCMGTGNPEEVSRNYSINIPMITSEKENAKKINNEIETKFSGYINNFNQKTESLTSFEVNYDYVIKNNIMYITIDETIAEEECGSSHTGYTDYFYDIENDKILSLQEGFSALGYNLDNLKQYGITSYEQCEKAANWCGCGFKIDDNKNITPFIKEQCS